MGKQSNLRKPAERQLYDRDKMPEGLDPEIWHLALFFEQTGEKIGKTGVAGRPIIYTELSNRISISNIRSKFVHWSGIIEDMIERFWGYELDVSKSAYAINEFCKFDTFDYILSWIVSQRNRQDLVDSAERISQPDPEIRESRRNYKDSVAAGIINKKYTQQELDDRIKRFNECRT